MPSPALRDSFFHDQPFQLTVNLVELVTLPPVVTSISNLERPWTFFSRRVLRRLIWPRMHADCRRNRVWGR